MSKKLTKYLTLYILFVTGCRPTEAAHILFEKTFILNDYKHLPYKWKATADSSFTKTHRDYTWMIPNEANDIVDLILRLGTTDYTKQDVLKEDLKYWYWKTMRDAGLDLENEDDERLNMRSIRCYFATEWVKFDAECKWMGWTRPPNPLQHESATTTLRYYSETGADNQQDAIKRCIVKYGAQAKKRLSPEQRKQIVKRY